MRDMRRRLMLAPLAAFALAAPAAAEAQTVTIQLTSVTVLTQIKDTPPLKKLNKGDAEEFKDLLINARAQFGRAKGKPVAFDKGVITYRGANTPQRIYGVINFTGIGTLIYEGSMMPAKHGNTVVKVTAGTGQFKGAHGTLTIGPGEAKARNTYHLVIPNGNLHVTGGGGGNVA
jgi:hypothetical protein